MKTPTIKDVATLAQVSIATVSRVINKNPSVAPEFVERVEAAMQDLRFRPNAAAQQIHRKLSSNIGLILPNITDPFFGNIANYVVSVATTYGQNVIIATSQSGNTYDEIACYQKMANAPIDGLILCSVSKVDQEIFDTYFENIPVVICSRHHLLNNRPHVYFDHEKGGYLATKHLLELGHRHIALLVGSYGEIFRSASDLDIFLADPTLSGPYTSIDKYLGVRRALAEKNIPFDPELVEFIDMGNPYHSGHSAMQRLISKTMDFDAVFCCNDFSATGAMHMLTSQKIDVPEMVSVIGYDDGILATCTQPQLSTVTQDTSILSHECVTTLNRLINHEKCEDVLIDVQLIVRYSSCHHRLAEQHSGKHA